MGDFYQCFELTQKTRFHLRDFFKKVSARYLMVMKRYLDFF